ncbi:MAG: hypothetical protein QF654_05370 [Alphaproteobacteria bacterium]|jgi:hypothetical protein|nr:hypothetical protein [Alphaproteobacteria bacterium]|tara:strand:+ start:108 stop:284 length:177 start_codon:yes stop_codon:yes gene_type:complete
MGKITVLTLALLATVAFSGAAYAFGDCGGATHTSTKQVVLDSTGGQTPIPPKTQSSDG